MKFINVFRLPPVRPAHHSYTAALLQLMGNRGVGAPQQLISTCGPSGQGSKQCVCWPVVTSKKVDFLAKSNYHVGLPEEVTELLGIWSIMLILVVANQCFQESPR